jgi:hypothetical protein
LVSNVPITAIVFCMYAPPGFDASCLPNFRSQSARPLLERNS